MSKTNMDNINLDKYKGAFDGIEISTNNRKNPEYNLSNIEGSFQTSLTEEIINNIDFDDKTFILRNINFQDYLENEDIKSLSRSIYSVGLINPVYIQQKENNKYRIVSGFRRLTAIYSGILSFGTEYTFDAEVVIIPKEYTKEDLDAFQVNENTHRENLKPLELAQRIYDASENYSIPIEEIGEQYNLGIRQTLKLKSILNYPIELKNIVNEIGVSNADLINRILNFKKLKEDTNYEEIKSVVSNLKDYSKSELEKYLKELKSNKSKQNIEIKTGKKNCQLNINHSFSTEELKSICDFINNIINSSKK